MIYSLAFQLRLIKTELMTNSEIVDKLELTGKLLELLDKDENRAKLYASVAFNLDRYDGELAQLSEAELKKIRGVGTAMAAAILEIIESGSTSELNDLIADTPAGVLEMFKVKGLGVKKIKTLWHELGIDNLNELRISCENGKIAETKGFGQKTQEAILASLAFLQAQVGKLRINKAHEIADLILNQIKDTGVNAEICGEVLRNMEVVSKLSFIVQASFEWKNKLNEHFIENVHLSSPFVWRGVFENYATPVEIILSSEEDFLKLKLLNAASKVHLQTKNAERLPFIKIIKQSSLKTEQEIYQAFGKPYILPEMRENGEEWQWIEQYSNNDLISYENLKGTLHNHSRYSDGAFSLKEMADYCKNIGLSYFGIADHSQTASYAGGLSPGRLMQQIEEIDTLNKTYENFKILKGIESDILADGSLDYENDILAQLDYVVASVHQNLNMDITKASTRLIKAIENPYTTILGHPTGRLLLSRDGYPIDYKKIIDACAANNVIMELNANPYRLDLDWRWIPYCMEKGVKISINPDAHHTNGFYDMFWGVAVARKGGLTKDMTFNAMSLDEITNYLKKS